MLREPKEKINSAAGIRAAIRRALQWRDMCAGDLHVLISSGNRKLGAIANNSLPPVATCHNCAGCSRYCYAVRSFNRLGDFNSWTANLAVYYTDPARYFREISAAAMLVKYFRWHVSGDIVDMNYLDGMVKNAVDNSSTQFLAFTKYYSCVNEYCDNNGGRGAIPGNLHIIFSAAPGLEMVNPYNFPECHVVFENSALNTYHGGAKKVHRCTGNCEECIGNCEGCFVLDDGDVVLINQH